MAARIVKIRALTRVGTIHSRPYVASGCHPLDCLLKVVFHLKVVRVLDLHEADDSGLTTVPRYVQSYGMYWSWRAEKRMSAIIIGKINVNTGTAKLMSESTPDEWDDEFHCHRVARIVFVGRFFLFKILFRKYQRKWLPSNRCEAGEADSQSHRRLSPWSECSFTMAVSIAARCAVESMTVLMLARCMLVSNIPMRVRWTPMIPTPNTLNWSFCLNTTAGNIFITTRPRGGASSNVHSLIAFLNPLCEVLTCCKACICLKNSSNKNQEEDE